MHSTITTSIIILNWNGLNNTRNCLHSLLRINSDNFNIIVVDNGSMCNEGRELVNEFGKRINLVQLNENLGFTGGVNRGIEVALKKYDPNYILLLNNDVEVEREFLNQLIKTAQMGKDYGIIGSKVYYFNKKDIQYSGGKINWFIARPFRTTKPHKKIVETEIVTGCSMLIKKQVIEKIGMLDDRFFAYFEDSAYCVKARNAGFKCVCNGESVIYHKENETSGRGSQLFTYLFSRNRILFVKYYTSNYYQVYFYVFNFLKLLFVLTYYHLLQQHKRADAYLRGYIDGTRGVYGKPNL